MGQETDRSSEDRSSEESPIARRIRAHKRFFRRATASFTDEDSKFTPAPGMLSVSGQIEHVTAALELFIAGVFAHRERFSDFDWVSHRSGGTEEWLGRTVGFGSMDWAEKANTEPVWNRPEDQLVSSELAAFDATMEIAAELFGRLTPEDMAEELPDNAMGLHNGQQALEIMLDHTAHHRGALVQYAGILGHDPSIPYFDMAEAKHEAQLMGAEHDAA